MPLESPKSLASASQIRFELKKAVNNLGSAVISPSQELYATPELDNHPNVAISFDLNVAQTVFTKEGNQTVNTPWSVVVTKWTGDIDDRHLMLSIKAVVDHEYNFPVILVVDLKEAEKIPFKITDLKKHLELLMSMSIYKLVLIGEKKNPLLEFASGLAASFLKTRYEKANSIEEFLQLLANQNENLTGQNES